MPDILKLEENLLGDDHFTTDLHGCFTQFRMVVEELAVHDRILCGGDMIDKGPNSTAILDLMIETNERRARQGLSQQIYCVRGNHEDMLYNHLDVLLNPDNYSWEDRTRIANEHIKNRGDWILKVEDKAKLRQYYDLVASFPYMILVTGKVPFLVVHTGRRLTYQQILDRIAQGGLLEPHEKFYSMWARKEGPESFLEEHLMAASTELITYCGHTPLGGIRLRLLHINLDFGTYKTGVLCVVNHTQKKIAPIFTPVTPDATIHSKCLTAIDDMHEYFQCLLLRCAITSLHTRFDEMEDFYTNANRRKHLTAIGILIDEFSKLQKPIITENLNSQQLNIIYHNMIKLVENAFDLEVRIWCKGLFTNTDPLKFTTFLNKDLSNCWPSHHYKRFLTITIDDLARETPDYVNKNHAQLASGIERPGNYNFSTLLARPVAAVVPHLLRKIS
jgi:hypothetical protein